MRFQLLILKIFVLLFEFLYIYWSYIYVYPFFNYIIPSIESPILQINNRNAYKDLIYEAINFLNLPRWSRNFHFCTSPKSEINCAQLIEAYQTIKNWSNVGINRPPYAVVHIKPRCGLGNSFYHILTGAVLGFSLNRTIHIMQNLEGVDYNPLLSQYQYWNCKQFGHWPIILQEHWQRNTFESLKAENIHITVTFSYPYFLMTEPGISNFIYEHFGIHFVYFMGNFIISYKDEIKSIVFKLINSVPKSVKIIGVHIRSHKHRTSNFISSQSKVKNVVIPFLNKLLENKNYIAIATDNKIYTDLFKKIYSGKLIMANVERRPDGNKYDASIDILLLMSCNKMIGTFRSSFSSFAGMCAMHRIYYVSMEYPKLFQFSNSQAGIISGIYEDHDDYNYFVNQRVKLFSNIEPAIRTFFRNIVY